MLRSLTPILSIIIAILLFVFFTKPAYDEVKVVQADISEHKKAIESYANFRNLLDERIATMNERSASDRERLSALLPESIDDAKLIVDLEALAKKHDLLFGNITSGDQDAKADRSRNDQVDDENGAESIARSDYKLTSLDIGFDVIGTYEQFKAFLADLERSLTIFDVTELTFGAGEGEFMQFSLTVRTYALSE